MTTTRRPRRYLIPTWLLWAIALAAFLALVLLPAPAHAATLDPTPAADVDPTLQLVCTLLAGAIGLTIALYVHLELNTAHLDRIREARAARRARRAV